MFDGDRYKEELNDLALQDLWAWRKFKQITAFFDSILKSIWGRKEKVGGIHE